MFLSAGFVTVRPSADRPPATFQTGAIIALSAIANRNSAPTKPL
jgi:hypothetical protein